MINEYLSNGTTDNAIGDYSTPDRFEFVSGETDTVNVERMIVSVGSSATMKSETYGKLAALTVGVQVQILNADGTLKQNLTANPIKSNAQWGAYCYDVDVKSWGNGAELLVVRWTFAKSGSPIKLKNGEKISVLLSDDFAGLTDHRFLIQGQQVAG